MVPHFCDLSTWEAKPRGSDVHGHIQLYSKFKASLGYVKTCLKKKTERFMCLCNRFQLLHCFGGIN